MKQEYLQYASGNAANDGKHNRTERGKMAQFRRDAHKSKKIYKLGEQNPQHWKGIATLIEKNLSQHVTSFIVMGRVQVAP